MGKLVFFLLCAFFLNVELFAEMPKAHAIRAVIEIGMGGPKLQVAEVNVETNKIVKVLHTQKYFINFYEDLSKDPLHRLSSDVMKQGLDTFKEAVRTAYFYRADGVTALATAPFRAASNGDEFAQAIQNQTDIKVHIVDQSLEGKLAFQATYAKADVDAEHLIVWDIGGGSIQFTALAADGTFVVDCREEGVGAFIDFIITKVQSRNLNECKTPNPMSVNDIVQAKAYARQLAQQVDRVVKDKISLPTTKVLAAGNVFGHGIAAIVGGKNPYCLEDLETEVYAVEGKTDADLGGGEFAFCEGANAILVLGLMQELGIKQVEIVHVNPADGALIYGPFWKTAAID